MAETQLQVQVLALHGSTVTDALDLELGAEALRDPEYKIVHKRPTHSPHLARAFHFFARLDGDAIGTDAGVDLLDQRQLEFALRPLHPDVLALDRRGDALWQRNRPFADARHCLFLLPCPRLEHLAEHFAADVLLASGGVCHHALRRRDDGKSEAIAV